MHTRFSEDCRKKNGLVLSGVLAFSLLVAACGGGSSPANSSSGSSGNPPAASASPIWMVNGGALNLMQQAGGQALATEFFSGPGNIIIGQRPSWAVSWAARSAISETSLSGIQQALQTGVPAGTSAVVYDLEDWSFSPLSEQENPVASTNTAATMVHKAGLLLIATPAVDLVNVLDPGASDKYQAYLSAAIPSAAQNADIFEIQAQGSEANTAQYTSFVTAAAAAARLANPNVKVLAGLSTNPDGNTVTAQQLYAAVQATQTAVDGYWLNIPSGGAYCPDCGTPQPQIAVELLQMLSASPASRISHGF